MQDEATNKLQEIEKVKLWDLKKWRERGKWEKKSHPF
jgi:hypothetical protein